MLQNQRPECPQKFFKLQKAYNMHCLLDDIMLLIETFNLENLDFIALRYFLCIFFISLNEEICIK